MADLSLANINISPKMATIVAASSAVISTGCVLYLATRASSSASSSASSASTAAALKRSEENTSAILTKLDRQHELLAAAAAAAQGQDSLQLNLTKEDEEESFETSGLELIVEACQLWEKALTLAHEQRNAAKVKRLRRSLRQAYVVLNTWNGGLGDADDLPSSSSLRQQLFASNCARLGVSSESQSHSQQQQPQHKQDGELQQSLSARHGIDEDEDDLSSIHSFHSTTMEVTELEEDASVKSPVQDASLIAADVDASALAATRAAAAAPPAASAASAAPEPTMSRVEPVTQPPAIATAPLPKPVAVVPLLKSAMAAAQAGEVKYRIDRTSMTHSRDLQDFMARLHVVRAATERMVQDHVVAERVTGGVKQILVKLFKMNGNETDGLVTSWDDIVSFTGKAMVGEDTRKALMDELQDRRVVCLSLFDVAIDFIFFDALDDLERLPSGVTAIFSNSWLPMSARAKALSSAVWSMVKAKEQLVKVPDGFFVRFYRVMEHISPVLACGLLKCSGNAKFITATIAVKELILEFTQKLFHAFDAMTDLDEAAAVCKALSEQYIARGEAIVADK